MKTTTSFIIFSIIILTFSMCIDDSVSSSFECSEEGKYLGIKYLTEKADSFWSYKSNQTRVYVNSAGNEFVFTEYIEDTYQEEIVEQPLEYLCNPPNSAPVYDYIDLEARKVRYQSSDNNSLWLKIELRTLPFFRADSIYFVDLLTTITRSYQSFTIDGRGTPDEFIFHDEFGFTADTTLLNKSFQDVYHDQSETYSVFYTKEQGVVAFYSINQDLYVLDRIE